MVRSTLLVAGTASRSLIPLVERTLSDARFCPVTIQRFPDGEVSVQLDESVRGRDVIALAATAPPVDEHLAELLALADACRRSDAHRIVAVMPYFGYARSDRRDGQRTAIMARLAAEILEVAGVNHVVTVDIHTRAIEGFFRIPVDNITAVPALAQAIAARAGGNAVIVAPDLGAVHLATRYAAALALPLAICQKQRLGGSEVAVRAITGDVRGRCCIIVDDMISTGGTIVESVRALREAGAGADCVVAATHAVFAPGAVERIAACGVRELLVTDTIEPRPADGAALTPVVVSVAPLVAAAIERLFDGRSLRDLS